MNLRRSLTAATLVLCLQPLPGLAQKVEVDLSGCRGMLEVMKAMKGQPRPEGPTAMLDTVLASRAYVTMFKHYNRPFRPNFLPKDVFKRMILSLRYEGMYAKGENEPADTMLPHWQAAYANLPGLETDIQQIEKADLRRAINDGIRRAQAWLPPEWKIPGFYYFLHLGGRSSAFAIDGAQGHDLFLLPRDAAGRLRLDAHVATVAHESHHLGMASTTPEGLLPTEQVAFSVLSLFVAEGTASKFVDNAPGGAVPPLDPAGSGWPGPVGQAWAEHTANERALFQRMLDEFEQALRGELTAEALNRSMRSFWLAGIKGPAYFVGAELYGAIHAAFGREQLFACMRDPRRTFETYRKALVAKPDLLSKCPPIPAALAKRALALGTPKGRPASE